VQRDARQRRQAGLQAAPERSFVLFHSRQGSREPIAPGTVAGDQGCQEVDGRGGSGQQFVGQDALLEPLGPGVRHRQQLVRAQGTPEHDPTRLGPEQVRERLPGSVVSPTTVTSGDRDGA
jgi:hypothetical protein